MLDYIKDVIHRFGGREAGSAAESGAQLYTAGILEAYCQHVEVQKFKAALQAHFGALKIFSVLYWAALYIFSTHYNQSKALAALLAMLNIGLFLFHFIGRKKWLDIFFPQQTSMNVEGVIEPSGQVKSTLIVSGHIDSVREYQWWYHLKAYGLVLNLISTVAILLQGVYFTSAWLYTYIGTLDGWITAPYYLLIICSPALLSFFFKDGEEVVDGAIDNLSGVALALEMAKVFSVAPLQNTRLRIVVFGSEEVSLRGSEAYVQANKASLMQEKATLLNIDGIKNDRCISILSGERNTLAEFPKDLVHKMEEAFSRCQVPVKVVKLPVGATDASSFALAGLPALSVIGIDTTQYDPTYHTRLDTLDNLDPKGLEAVRNVLIQFIKTWDEDQEEH
jgi:hypothetical protein